MLDEVISFYSFLDMNFELTAALSVLTLIVIIFSLAFLAHFVTKNYVIKYLRQTILSREKYIPESFKKYRPFENVAHLVSAIVIYSFADLMTTDDSSITWLNESVEWLEDGGVIYATLAIIWFLLGLLNVANDMYQHLKKTTSAID